MRQLTLLAVLSVTGTSATATQAAYVDVVLADNPVGYYRLEEASSSAGAKDSSVTNATGTYNNFFNPAAFGQTGIPAGGNAVLFDGFNDWINTNNTSIVGSDQTYTLEVWINIGTTDLTSTGYAVSHLRDNTNNRYHALGVTSGEIAIMAQDQNSASSVVDTTPPIKQLNDGKWHHLVGVFNSGNASDEDKLYLDGQLIASMNGPAEDSATNRVYIGLLHNRSGGTGWFKGLIDEVAIYNGLLSAERILAHYNAGITIPEPASLALVVAGGLLMLPRRKRAA